MVVKAKSKDEEESSGLSVTVQDVRDLAALEKEKQAESLADLGSPAFMRLLAGNGQRDRNPPFNMSGRMCEHCGTEVLATAFVQGLILCRMCHGQWLARPGEVQSRVFARQERARLVRRLDELG